MSNLRILALSVLLVASSNADHPITWYREFEPVPIADEVNRNTETMYRLPESVIPLAYDIYLDLYFDERTDRPFSYDGKENIVIQAVEENITQIVLHSNVDNINTISLTNSISGAPFTLNPLEPFSLEPAYHFLKINLVSPMIVGQNYTLTIGYSSTMNEGPMKRGIWRGWYRDNNNVERFYATTHFQPYNARQAFPCWDEPLFKAVFRLHITRPSTYFATYTNTGSDAVRFVTAERIQETFHATPKMSSYLLTFLVSESFEVIAQNTSFSPPIRIIGRSSSAGLGDHALRLSVRMTEHFEEYFGIPYSSLHPNLFNDHISSPDWASAGTENWGMVSYRELYLIINPNETIMSVEHYATTLVSHELAHKWFGNLITCYWWSNTWINEGFASYFGYIAGHKMFPQYELHEHFNSRYLQNSLAFDSGTGTVPLNHEVNTPAQVTGHFGTISYSKGAAFLRMTANIITPGTFRKACQKFLSNNAYEPTDQYDLYNAFAEAIQEDNSLAAYPNFNFQEYYAIWVNEAGYPILLVDVNHSTGTINLKQERFFLSSTVSPTGQIYPIPITFSTRSNSNFENLTPTQMMTSAEDTVTKTPGEEWVIFNNLQHGHYRVQYDTQTWNLIADALLNEPETIHYLNRAQVVDDVFALMRSQRMSYNFGFHILKFLRHETNFHVWDPAITGYTWLRNRLRHLPESQTVFDSFILSYLDHAIEELGFDVGANETPTVSMTRQNILQFACNLGHSRCIEESKARFALMKNNEWVDPRLRRSVYMVGIREGDRSDFEFLLNRFMNSNFANDQLEMLRGMAATKDPVLLNEYLAFTLTKEVRSHDKVNAFNYALLGNQENAWQIMQFVKNNIDEIRVAYVEDAPATPVHSVLSNLASYLDEAGLVEFEEWVLTTQTNTLQYSTAVSAINSARTNIAWGTNNVDIILQAARDSATKITTSAIMMLAMVVLAVAV